MSATFETNCDLDRDLIRTRIGGFFSADDIATFATELRAATARLRCGRHEHLSLHDIRDMKIQSQDVVTRFQAMMIDPAFRSRRLAFVVASSLARMQLLRAIGPREARLFEDEDTALHWLLTGEEPPRENAAA